MNAYNQVNGAFCSENHFLLNQVLKDEWQHEGLVVTDWGANNDHVDGVKNGQELTMPYDYGENTKIIVEAVENSDLAESVLDSRVERIVELILKSKKTLEEHRDYTYDPEAHHRLAREAAAEIIVRLKNEGALPLDVNKKILVIGEFAENPRYQGGDRAGSIQQGSRHSPRCSRTRTSCSNTREAMMSIRIRSIEG